MNKINYVYYDSGIIAAIINTKNKWIDYSVSIDWTKNDEGTPLYKSEHMSLVVSETIWDDNGDYSYNVIATDIIPFNHREYHRVDEQDDDQIVVYFIPRSMIIQRIKP